MQQGCIIDDSHCWMITIGDNVFIGVGSRSVVTKDILSNSMTCGNKIIKSYDEYIQDK